MEAVIKVSSDELQQDLLDKLKLLIRDEDVDIFIQLRKKPQVPDEGTPEDYWRSLNDSIADKQTGRTTVFSMDEFRQYVNDNFSQ